MSTETTNNTGLQKPTNFRWVICGLLLAAMAINYIHRQTFGLLKDNLMLEFNWNETDYSNVVIAFQVAYALGYVSFGAIIDKIGSKLGYTIAFVLWTTAHTLTGFTATTLQIVLARIGLGFGEAGSFPASLKTIANWFPQKERAYAAGWFNAGANIGAIIAPIVVPLLTLAYGWQSSFIVTGALSFIWVILWIKLFKNNPAEHKSVNEAELALINSDPPETTTKVPWLKIVTVKETWAFALGKFMIDPIWWFYLFWLPGYLGKNFGLDLKTFGPPIVAIYLISDVGSVLGGWVSSNFIKRGMSVNLARKITLLIFAICVLPIFLLQNVTNLWIAVLIIGVAAAAHQAFSANLFTLPSDLFPRSAVGSVIGFGGMVGAIGGIVFSNIIGKTLDATQSYTTLFMIAGSAYLVALLIIQLLTPKLEKVSLDKVL